MNFILLASRNERFIPPGGTHIPRNGELYGVAPSGDLRWYQYAGSGVSSPSGAIGWGPKSGNVIHSGWDRFKFLVCGGNGQIFAVDKNGYLQWYVYNGDGTEDRSGKLMWNAVQPITIGNGWDTFINVICTTGSMPSVGVQYVAPVLYGVEPGGDLRWYRYDGSGQNNPTGNTGWAPNSGNRIGNGWQNFQILFAAGSALFGVEPNGTLRWYAYAGQGTEDRSGGTGWLPNSGNAIGRGWNRFSKIVGGLSDRDGLGIELFAVEPNGNLFWYKYLGQGESNPSGDRGWHPNSGHQIGHGW